MRRSAFLLALIAALTAATLVSAAIRHDPDSAPQPVAPGPVAGAAEYGQRDLDQLLRNHGIDPDSNKARIILAWVEKIQHDPVIASDTHGGARHVGEIFLDSRAREEFMSNGLAHLTPSDRLQYVKLLTKFLDELVPVNCFGLHDMRAVMNRVYTAAVCGGRASTHADTDRRAARRSGEYRALHVLCVQPDARDTVRCVLDDESDLARDHRDAGAGARCRVASDDGAAQATRHVAARTPWRTGDSVSTAGIVGA
jgi:hypothetical protein